MFKIFLRIFVSIILMLLLVIIFNSAFDCDCTAKEGFSWKKPFENSFIKNVALNENKTIGDLSFGGRNGTKD